MRWADASELVPDPVFIAGTRMRPFCLGHHLLFRKLGFPFAGCPDADASQGDILNGVLVCAQSYEDTLDQLHSGEWDETQRHWLKRVAKRRTDLDDVEKRFREMLRKAYKQPPVINSHGAGFKLSAPWECLLKVRLQSIGFSETEILNGYLPARWYDYYTAIETVAADNCENPKHWRQIFVTRQMADVRESMNNG